MLFEMPPTARVIILRRISRRQANGLRSGRAIHDPPRSFDAGGKRFVMAWLKRGRLDSKIPPGKILNRTHIGAGALNRPGDQCSDPHRVPDTEVRRARVDMEARRLSAVLAAEAFQTKHSLETARVHVDTALAALQLRLDAWNTKKADWKHKGQAQTAAWRDTRKEWKIQRT
jgi:hypothetical protein